MPSNEFRNQLKQFCDNAGLNLYDTEFNEILGKKNTSTDDTQIDTNKNMPYNNRIN